MYRTFLDPKSCGFAKIGAINAGKKAKRLEREFNESSINYGARVLKERYLLFQDMFASNTDSFEIPFNEFNKKVKSLDMYITKWRKCSRKNSEMQQCFDTFQPEVWSSFTDSKRREHTLFDCKGCHHSYAKTQAYFPVKSPLLKNKAKQNPFSITESTARRVLKNPNKTKAKESAKELYNRINAAFESVCGLSFGEALAQVPETNLQIKQSSNEKKAVRRDILRKNKENIETEWMKTSVER